MSRAKTVISADGFEMDSMTYGRKARTRLQAAQDLLAVAAVMNEAMAEYENLEKRRNEIFQEVNNLKEDIRRRVFSLQQKINAELKNIDEEYAADMEELEELTKFKAKCEMNGEQFRYQDKLDVIHGRISTYDVRRQAVEELKAEMKVSSSDQRKLNKLESAEYELIQKIESIQSACTGHYLVLAEDAKKKISLKCEYRSIQIMKDRYADKYRLNF